MIVLDEQIGNSPRLRAAVARWYPGAVISVQDLRPYGRIEDPEIPDYLLQLKQPTFVTINYRDFWLRRLAHSRYCIVCFKLRQDEALLSLRNVCARCCGCRSSAANACAWAKLFLSLLRASASMSERFAK